VIFARMFAHGTVFQSPIVNLYLIQTLDYLKTPRKIGKKLPKRCFHRFLKNLPLKGQNMRALNAILTFCRTKNFKFVGLIFFLKQDFISID